MKLGKDRAKEGLLLPVIFVGKQSEGHSYEIEEFWNLKLYLFFVDTSSG